LPTAMANGNNVGPTITATPFGGEQARSAGGVVAGLNPRGWVAREHRQFGPLGGLIGPLRGLLG
jgi:hypothetical protein